MKYFRKTATDIGVCAALKCPHCLAESTFLLHKQATTFTYLGIRLFDLDRLYQLRCSLCKYSKDIDDRELFPAMKAVKLFSKLSSQKLTPTEYAEALERLGFRSLKELQEAAKTWNCLDCGESVPVNFSECWNCNATRPDLKTSNDIEPFKAPRLPADITRPVNPWD